MGNIKLIQAYLADFSYIKSTVSILQQNYETKNARRYYIDKIFLFYFCNIFKIGEIGATFSNFAVLRCKLNGHCRKIPDIFFNFFYLNCFPSPYLSRAVCPVKISHNCRFQKNLVQTNIQYISYIIWIYYYQCRGSGYLNWIRICDPKSILSKSLPNKQFFYYIELKV